jgi:hypothetical protein
MMALLEALLLRDLLKRQILQSDTYKEWREWAGTVWPARNASEEAIE